MRRLLPLLSCFLVLVFVSSPARSASVCTGTFVNPVTDVCWECIFPINIGPITLFEGRPDPPGPESLVCTCPAPPPLMVRIGLPIGFWEPARLVDVTRRPYCFVNLGGLKLDAGVGTGQTKVERKDGQTSSASWHVHWYTYPVWAMLEMFTDIGCVSQATFDIAYITELDPLWLDDELTFILNPEAVLFANPIAQAACAADCLAASAGLPLTALFWCAGCQGSLYPLSGNVSAHVNSIQSSLLVTERMAYKLGRELVLWGASGVEAMCQKIPRPILKKSEWRTQLTNPVAMTSGVLSCNPLGRSSVPYEAGREIPVRGEDFGWLLWRKRDCCAL